MEGTFEKLVDIFQEVFQDDDLVITPETTANDIEDWDSVMHVTLIVNVEQAFGLRFPMAKVTSLNNVGELVNLIDSIKV